ncbi:MAG: hypothetical protein HZA54_11710, partial [Planctomycetes bacterium]|nr:hypothetical protein [Planctomycetota bacterium]
MGDNETLLAILAALCLVECGLWLRRDTVLFASAWGGPSRPRHPWAVLGNRSTGLFLGNPLPPFGSALPCPAWPLSATPEAVLGWVATTTDPAGRSAQGERCLRWEEVRGAAAEGGSGGGILVNGTVFTWAGTPGVARAAAEFVERVRQAEAGGAGAEGGAYLPSPQPSPAAAGEGDGGGADAQGAAGTGDSAVHCPPTTVHRSPSAVHCPPTTVHRPPSAVHCPPATDHRPPTTVNRPPATVPRVAAARARIIEARERRAFDVERL